MAKHKHKVTADLKGEFYNVRGAVADTLIHYPEAKVLSSKSSRPLKDSKHEATTVIISGETDGVVKYVDFLLRNNPEAVILDSEFYIMPEDVSPLGQLFVAIKRIGEIITFCHTETTASRTSEIR